MTSVNIFCKILKLSFLIAVIFLLSIGCGSKTRPIPPYEPPAKRPRAPEIAQKDNSVEVVFENPFLGQQEDWRLRLYRLKQLVLPKKKEEVEKEKEYPEEEGSEDENIKDKEGASFDTESNSDVETGKDFSDTDKPNVVVLSSGDYKRRLYPPLPELDEERFKDRAVPILDISSEDYTDRAAGARIVYRDPAVSPADRYFPDAYYYAVRADDSENKIDGYSDIEGLITLPIAEAPKILEWEVKERYIEFLFQPNQKNEEFLFGDYFSGYNVYRGDCEKMPEEPLLSSGINFIPERWTAEAALKIIPSFHKDGKVLSWYVNSPLKIPSLVFKPVDHITVVTAGRDNQGLKQVLVSKEEIENLKGARLKLKAAVRSKKGSCKCVDIFVSDGRTGKIEPIKAYVSDEWTEHEFEYEVPESALSLEVRIAPENDFTASAFDIKSISLKVISLKEKEAEETSETEKEIEESAKEDEVKTDEKTVFSNSTGEESTKENTENDKSAETTEKSEKPDPDSNTEADAEEKAKREFTVGEELIKNEKFFYMKDLTFRDQTFAFERRYCYRMVAQLNFDGKLYEGKPGEPVEITPHDIFPPRAPKGLYMLARLDSLTLVWQPNSEGDLAGYNIYRRKDGEDKFIRLNEKPIERTEYVDKPPEAGEKYFYHVRAVDNSPRTNESEPSTTVEFVSRGIMKTLELEPTPEKEE